jgi:predicted Zn finger-like uncharacterized protein
MSFITQCPACETQFKVSPEQLKVSEGWVRCGQCHHVFDASLNLQPWWPEVPPGDAAVTDSPVEPPSPPVPQTDQPDDQPDTAPVTGDVSAAIPDPATPAEPVGHQHAAPPVEAIRDATPEPRFVKQAAQRAYWHRTSIRMILIVLIAGLTVLLAVQWFHKNKDEWALQYPQTRPWIQSLCGWLRCEVDIPRRLSEVVVESSSFVRVDAQRFVFQLMLRNRASTEVAMPTLELTLSDIDNQVIARRIIPPTEWPQQPMRLTAMAEWPLRLELRLDLPQGQVVTGYQAELFYP